MSNSIWKTPTVRPVKDCIVVWQNPARMSFTLPKTARKDMEMYNCERWATLDDLIAQADKAERLQKAQEDLKCAEEELKCTKHNYSVLSEQKEIAYQNYLKITGDLQKQLQKAQDALDKVVEDIDRALYANHYNDKIGVRKILKDLRTSITKGESNE